MDKKEAYLLVYNELRQIPLFVGVFDAKNGNADFMTGIDTVMEYIATGAGKAEEQNNEFFKNLEKSYKKA